MRLSFLQTMKHIVATLDRTADGAMVQTVAWPFCIR